MKQSEIGFTGLGQAGSNLCEIAELFKYRTVILNTSPEDLASIVLVQNKKLIGTEGGAGKDRRIAKDEVKKHFSDIVEFVREKFKNSGVKMIYVAFSTGGGTGSGMGPIVVDLLKRMIPEYNFGAIAILPSEDESSVAQANNLDCSRELVALNVPTIVIDNEKVSKANPGISRKQLYDSVNNQFFDAFNAFVITEREPSKYGNLDSKDRLKLLQTPGNTIIAVTEVNANAEGMSVQKQIINSWDRSVMAPLEYDGVIRRMGFIYQVDDQITKAIAYNELNMEVGKPLEVFEGFYKPESGKNVVVSIITGLSFPEDRIAKSQKTLEKGREEFVSEKEYKLLGDKDSTNWFSDARGESAKKKDGGIHTEEDLENLFDQY